MGWRGSARHWHRYETAYLLLAGSRDAAGSFRAHRRQLRFRRRHRSGLAHTIFPPYFVAGAIYSGFAMVVCLAIPIRAIYGLKDFITERHLENAAKVMLGPA